MAGRGSAPGEHRGGRKKGVPNKSSLSRSAEIAEEHRKANLPLAVEILENSMLKALKLAQQFEPQPNIFKPVLDKDGKPVLDADGKPRMAEIEIGNEPLYGKYLDKAILAAGKLAPYQTPTLQSTTHTVERLDLTRLSDAELTQLERIYAKADQQRAASGGESPTQH